MIRVEINKDCRCSRVPGEEHPCRVGDRRELTATIAVRASRLCLATGARATTGRVAARRERAPGVRRAPVPGGGYAPRMSVEARELRRLVEGLESMERAERLRRDLRPLDTSTRGR